MQFSYILESFLSPDTRLGPSKPLPNLAPRPEVCTNRGNLLHCQTILKIKRDTNSQTHILLFWHWTTSGGHKTTELETSQRMPQKFYMSPKTKHLFTLIKSLSNLSLLRYFYSHVVTEFGNQYRDADSGDFNSRIRHEPCTVQTIKGESRRLINNECRYGIH